MTIRILAVISGWIAILLPLARLLLDSKRMKGRSIGSGTALRRWPAVLIMSMSLIALGIVLWKPLPIELSDWLERTVLALGGLFYFPAIFLYIWGWLTLGKMYGVSSSGGADLYADHQIIKDGPYKIMRHPMYLAVILAAVGGLLIFQTWAMLIFAPMSLVVILRSKHEETLLEMEFGSDWREYSSDVPKWLPRLSRKN